MRASVLVLGPLLARAGLGARVAARRLRDRRAADRPAPGGLREAGRRGPARPRLRRGEGRAADRAPRSCSTRSRSPGTENVMLAATLARGTTRLVNAAREPEVTRPGAMLLRAMGAQISGAGTETIAIEGVEKLHGATHADHPGPDRGRHLRPGGGRDARRRRGPPLRAGAPVGADDAAAPPRASRIDTIGDTLRVRADGPLVSHDVATAPYPGLPDRPAGPVDGARDGHGRASRRSPRRSSRTASSTSPSSSAWAPGSASRAAGRSSRAPRG